MICLDTTIVIGIVNGRGPSLRHRLAGSRYEWLLHLAPLAGRGRNSRAAGISGEGESQRGRDLKFAVQRRSRRRAVQFGHEFDIDLMGTDHRLGRFFAGFGSVGSNTPVLAQSLPMRLTVQPAFMSLLAKSLRLSKSWPKAAICRPPTWASAAVSLAYIEFRPSRKNSDFPKFLLTPPPNHHYIPPHPVPQRGVSGSSETRGGMRWTRQRQA
jgi:hypothetical protein